MTVDTIQVEKNINMQPSQTPTHVMSDARFSWMPPTNGKIASVHGALHRLIVWGDFPPCPHCALFPCLITTFSEPVDAKNDLESVQLSILHREMSLFFYKQIVHGLLLQLLCIINIWFGTGRPAFKWRLSVSLPVVWPANTPRLCPWASSSSFRKWGKFSQCHGQQEGEKVTGSIPFFFCLIADTQ